MNAPAHVPHEQIKDGATSPARRDCYTQGMDRDGSPNGDFETTWIIGLDRDEALAWVARLPEPRHESEPCAFCPPTFGVKGYGNVCRIEGGQYVRWSPSEESVDCSLVEATRWVSRAFEQGGLP